MSNFSEWVQKTYKIKNEESLTDLFMDESPQWIAHCIKEAYGAGFDKATQETKFTKERLEFLEKNVTMLEEDLGIQDINCDVEGNVNGTIGGTVNGDIDSVEGNVGCVIGDIIDVKGGIVTVEGDIDNVIGDIDYINGNITMDNGDFVVLKGCIDATKTVEDLIDMIDLLHKHKKRVHTLKLKETKDV